MTTSREIIARTAQLRASVDATGSLISAFRVAVDGTQDVSAAMLDALDDLGDLQQTMNTVLRELEYLADDEAPRTVVCPPKLTVVQHAH